MQCMEFTVAFLNSVLSAVHQHVNFEDLKGRKKLVVLLGENGEFCCWESVESYQEETSGCCTEKKKGFARVTVNITKHTSLTQLDSSVQAADTAETLLFPPALCKRGNPL